MSSPLSGTVERILEAIVEDIGLPLVLGWFFARTPREQAQALLDAQYRAAAAAIDAEAARELGGKSGA